MSVTFTWFGHATIGLDVAGKHILVDPFLTDTPSAMAKPETLSPDYIWISHGHGDHTGDALAIAQRCGATVISNFEIASWFESKGVTTHAQPIGGGPRHPFGYLKLTLALHGSALPDGGAVQGQGQLEVAERVAGPTADGLGVCGHTFALKPGSDLEVADDGGAAALGDGKGVARVVPMTVRNPDVVGREGFGFSHRRGVIGQEGIHQDALSRHIEADGGVAKPGERDAHAAPPPSGCDLVLEKV